jgi:alpha-1,3/alpha-1,6-mannosyltransferase
MCQHTTFVSINRFERKKDVGKAVRAFALLATQLEAVEFKSLRLILAGGYDPRVAENVEYKEELEDLAAGLGVKDQVIFKPSFSGEERSAMLEKGLCIVYTPANEHFGIVPVEGMYAGLPVVACNSGGPMESISEDPLSSCLAASRGFVCLLAFVGLL